MLVYLYAEPAAWPDGPPVPAAVRARHADAVRRFAVAVTDQAVGFVPLTYAALLDAWERRGDDEVARHAAVLPGRVGVA